MALTRRVLLSSTAAGVGLAGLGAVGLGTFGLAACSRQIEDLPPDLRAALDREESLLALLRATLLEHPALSAVLLTVAADHEQHRAELRRRGGLDPLPSPSAGAAGDSPVPAESPAPPDRAVPATAPEALAALAQSENAASVDAREACVRSEGDLAGTYASLGASEASHALLLMSVPAEAT